METTTIRIMPDGLQIPRHEVDMVLDGDYWVVRPQNGILNYQVEPFVQELDEETAKMEQYEAVYKILHPMLKETHLGRFVAIHNDVVVDSDSDDVALYRRIDAAYPDDVVLIRQVEAELPRTLQVSSAVIQHL